MSEKLKEKIKKLEEKYRVITDNLVDAIWVVDAKTLKSEFITPSIEKISGYTADEFMNFTIKDRLTPESEHFVRACVHAFRQMFMSANICSV